MKKTLALIVVALMAVTAVFAGCGSGNNNSSKADDKSSGESKTAATVTEDGGTKFIVGFDAEFPPYGYKDEETGEYTGFDLELAEEVCKRLGWEFVAQPIEWDSKDMELNSGTINCIWNGFTIQGREDDYTWSVPYVDNSQVVVVKKDSGISKLKDLSGKTVVVQSDSSALHALTDKKATKANKQLCASFKELQQVDNYNTAFMNLESGAVDAICMDIGVASYNVEKKGDAYVILDDKIATEQYGVGFKKGNDALKDTVEKTLLEMADDGTVKKLAKKYSLTDAVCIGK